MQGSDGCPSGLDDRASETSVDVLESESENGSGSIAGGAMMGYSGEADAADFGSGSDMMSQGEGANGG
jgi:hypothetical protein